MSINSTYIYISSLKRMLNRPISMEVRFNTFPLSCVDKEFSISILNNLKEVSCREVLRIFFESKKLSPKRPKKTGVGLERAYSTLFRVD